MGILDKWEISIPPKARADDFTDNKQILFLNDIGRQAAITDFAILLGGIVYDNNDSLRDRCGVYWTKEHNYTNINVVNENGDIQRAIPSALHCGVRPFIEFNVRIKDNSDIDAIWIYSNLIKRISEKKYGYYPQMAPSKKIQEELEQAYKEKTLFRTNITYSVPESFKEYENERNCNMNNSIKTDLMVYEYDEKLYVRVPVHFDVILSNWTEYHKGEYVWIEVEPIKWYVSEKCDSDSYMIAKKILFSGVPYTQKNIDPYNYQYLDPEFSKFFYEYSQLTPELKENWFYIWESEINKFIENYWSKDIKKVERMKNSYEYRQRKKEIEEINKKESIDNFVTQETTLNIDNAITNSVKEIKKTKILRKFINKNI